LAVQDIVDVLNQMADLHDQMIELSEKKKEAIVRNDMKALNQIVLKEAEFIKLNEALEQRRVSAVNRYWFSKGYGPKSDITLSEMIKMVVRIEDKMELQNAQARLEQSIGTLKQLNEINQQLLQESLSYLDYSLNLLLGSNDSDDAIYSIPSKNGFAGNRTGFFDLKA
jgi:flagellar biosynthesis/type III secretory pathway chaperone